MGIDNSHLTGLVFLLVALVALLGACGTPPEVSPGAPPQVPPTLPPAPTPAPTDPPALICTDAASLEGELTIPEGTVLLPGQAFVKTWRLRNAGTCTWTTDYALVFAGGERMDGPEAIPLPAPVTPDSLVDLSVTLRAPDSQGTYAGHWQLRNAAGTLFGIGGQAGALWVRILAQTPAVPTPVPPIPTPAPIITGWRGEYYSNVHLAGAPALVRNDVAIDFDWGSTAPASGLPADGFAVRWTRTLSFEPGSYRFRALVDDGLRLWLDECLLIDAWSDGSARELSAEHNVTAGPHSLRIEYYERSGSALIRVDWDRLERYPDWKGEYYANTSLSGEPGLVRNDVAVDFDWGRGSPAAGLPVDGFSARWTGTRTFEEGTYRFHLLVDDGARLYIDDRLVLDSWSDGAAREVTADWALPAGPHQLRIEYYERSAQAQIRAWWKKVDGYFPEWKGEYWSNPTLSGQPALMQNEGEVDFDWGLGSAAGGMPVDNWSARWTRALFFEAGTYRFRIRMDDGARLWVDDILRIDAWQDGEAREVTADVVLTRGSHRLRAEFYTKAGPAQMRLGWEALPPPNYPDWKGQYWSNMELRGEPKVVRNDLSIDFDWGPGAAAPGLPADKFSARWERWVNLASGTYTFYARADNGVRFYLDGRTLIDAWYSNGQDVFTARVTLSGPHYLVVEYYDNGGAAAIEFWWSTNGASRNVR